jgi:ADP-ribose pyrophosphatase YjhB (NUDIX family)
MVPLAPPRIRVAALIVEDGRVLAVEHVKKGESYFLLPGGGLDPGETMATALVRELNEELGCEADVGALALVTESLAPDASRHVIQMIFHATRRGEPRVTGIDDRIQGFRWLDAAAADQVPFRPSIGPWIRAFLRDEAPEAHYRLLEWT